MKNSILQFSADGDVFFVLRKDVARSDDALFFQKLLDKINTIQYSSKKEFKVKHRKFGKKIYEERQQNLERIFPDAYTKKEFTEREKKYFYPTLEHDLYWKRLIWVYRFLEPWRFELKIEPNIIYRTKIKDFDLIKRLDEMHQYLEWNNLQTKQCRLMHGHYQDPNRYWYSDLEKYRNPFRNKRLVDILSEYEAENLADTINEKPSPDEGFFYFDYVCCIDLRCLSAQQKRSHENNKHQWQQITIHLLWQKRPAC